MLWFFLACSIWAVPSCCRILLNLFQQSNGLGMLQGSGRKGFFLHFTALFSVRTESSKFLRVLFCNVKCFSLQPQDKPWEALLTCCTGLR